MSNHHNSDANGAEILIVEDSPTQAQLLQHLLERRHYSVSVARSGQEALQKLAERKPTLLISDINMPEMNGYQLCKQVRGNQAWRDLPVMLVTSLSAPQDIIAGLECGADNFIRKPYDEKYLLSRVEFLLANARLPKSDSVQMGLEVYLAGQKHFITAERQQMLHLLISTYDQAVELNRDLLEQQKRLDRANRTLAGLYRIAKGINQAVTEQEVVDRVLDCIQELPWVRAGWIFLIGADSNARLAGCRGLPPALAAPNAMGGECTCLRQLRNGELSQPVNVLDCERLRLAEGDTAGLRCHVSVPVRIGDRVLGILNLVGEEKGLFTEDDRNNLNGIGGQIGIALERARLYEHLEQRVEERTAALQAEIKLRRQSEEALQRSEARCRDLLENANDLFQSTSAEGRLLYANRAWRETMGYGEEEVGRLMAWDVIDPRDHEHCREILRRVLAGESLTGVEARFIAKDGHRILVEGNINAKSDEGRAVCTRAIFRDITARKQAEEQIRELVTLVDASHDAIVVRDLEGRIKFYNQGAARLYGWTAEEALQRAVSELLFPDTGPLREAREALLERGKWQGELEVATKAGDTRTVDSRWTLWRDSERLPQSILVISTDITERKRLEAQALRGQRLESIGTLAGGIAHDLNNVLAPILMVLELLHERITDPDGRGLLSTLETSAQRGADMVKQILTFARGAEEKPMAVQARYLMRDVVSMLKPTLPNSIVIETVCPRDLWTIQAVPTQLSQVLMNLCVNARDAMPNGGRLTIDAENVTVDDAYASMSSEATPGPYLVVSVADTGTGIPPGVLPRIFDPFFTTKPAGKGTGIGLATVRGIVKSHGGFLTVYSEVGKGTRFRVYLPARTAAAKEAEGRSERPSMPMGNGETILIVDDEAAIRNIAQLTLTAFGYRVLTASHGAEAVALCAQNAGAIRLMVTDMAMPIMDGPATIRAVRTLDPSIKVVATSGLGPTSRTSGEDGLDFASFLPKPYTGEALVKTVQAVLKPPA